MEKLSSLSLVFPAYNDEHTIPLLVRKAIRLAPKLTNDFEIIVVNDGSKDNTGKVLLQLQKEYRNLQVISHKNNQGYGGALMSGFMSASKEFIFYTDGDGQYDVEELLKLVKTFDEKTDIVTGFKIKRSDPWYRRLLGDFYNWFVKLALGIRVKDVDCDFRLFKRTILQGITVSTQSSAFDAELIKKLEDKGARFKEIPVSHYPRRYGKSEVFHFAKIAQSLWDLSRLLLRSS